MSTSNWRQYDIAANTDQPELLVFFCVLFTLTCILGRSIKMNVNRIGCLDGCCNLYSAGCSERLVSHLWVSRFHNMHPFIAWIFSHFYNQKLGFSLHIVLRYLRTWICKLITNVLVISSHKDVNGILWRFCNIVQSFISLNTYLVYTQRREVGLPVCSEVLKKLNL
jgi:hypothetical protein